MVKECCEICDECVDSSEINDGMCKKCYAEEFKKFENGEW